MSDIVRDAEEKLSAAIRVYIDSLISLAEDAGEDLESGHPEWAGRVIHKHQYELSLAFKDFDEAYKALLREQLKES